jgi:hypothetical protein
MKRFILPYLLTLTLILTACSAATPSSASTITQPAPVSNTISTPTDKPAILATQSPNTADSSDMTRTDQQGAVVFEMTPLNLGTPSDTLEFNVSLNTHSVDLGMDLATLATLKTDTGVTVQATQWDAPRGGHHVEGKLIFPAAKDSKPILEGATKLTLTIINLDAPSRIFEWELK